MMNLLEVRHNIYNHFHASKTCQEYFFASEREDDFVAYYTSMFTLLNTGEALLVYREKSFSKDPHIAYIEFWGVMQAIFIQQDCIKELYRIIFNRKLSVPRSSKWSELRELRNLCAGHPICKEDRENKRLKRHYRSFMGRNFGDYTNMHYEQWDKFNRTMHPEVLLGDLIDSYEKEAVNYLQEILDGMATKWPKN